MLFDKLIGCFRSAGVEPDIVQEATPVTTWRAWWRPARASAS
jgi:hypothetical protein